MEVTKENFKAAVALLKDLLKDADFISIDGEFTGLSTFKKSWLSKTLYDYYDKLKVGSNRFLLIQYGICVFLWRKESKQYEAMPFTFYIYPRPYKKVHNDIIFSCQSSCLDFLAKNGFDFNKLFHKGVSFMFPEEEKNAREKLHKYNNSNDTLNSSLHVENEKKSVVFIPQAEKIFMDNICKQVQSFIEDNSTKILDLQPCSAFQRKLIYETLEEKFPKGLYLESITKENYEKSIRVVKIVPKDDFLRRKLQEENKLLEEIIGFTSVIKLLSNSKKPIVGHNMILDIFLTVTNFFSQPPDDLYEFKSLVSTLFPYIFDTKLMASMQPISNVITGTSLSKLNQFVAEKVLPEPNIVLSEKINDLTKAQNVYHQAGYDSFCTGKVFVSLVKYLSKYINSSSERIDFSSNVMLPFLSRINVSGITDTQFLDFRKLDKSPSESNVFYIKHPREWQFKDIEDIFEPYCALLQQHDWISETETLVTICDPSKVTLIIDDLVLAKNVNNVFKVSPYNNSCFEKEDGSNNNQALTSIRKRLHKEEKQSDEVNGKRSRVCREVEDGEIESESDEINVAGLFEQPSSW